MGLALASEGKSSHQVLTERTHGRPADATLQADKNPVSMRSVEWLHNDKYWDDKLSQTYYRLAVKNKAEHNVENKRNSWKVDILGI